MTDAAHAKSLHENPLGLDGFEFVEFTGPDPQAMADMFVDGLHASG